MSRSELVEVSEKLRNSNSLFDHCFSDSCDCVIDIIRHCSNSVVTCLTNSSLGVEVPTVVEVSLCAEKLVATVHIINEVVVVDFINVSLVHVATEHLLLDFFGG